MTCGLFCNISVKILPKIKRNKELQWLDGEQI